VLNAKYQANYRQAAGAYRSLVSSLSLITSLEVAENAAQDVRYDCLFSNYVMQTRAGFFGLHVSLLNAENEAGKANCPDISKNAFIVRANKRLTYFDTMTTATDNNSK